jgi:hypothetical protein
MSLNYPSHYVEVFQESTIYIDMYLACLTALYHVGSVVHLILVRPITLLIITCGISIMKFLITLSTVLPFQSASLLLAENFNVRIYI